MNEMDEIMKIVPNEGQLRDTIASLKAAYDSAIDTITKLEQRIAELEQQLDVELRQVKSQLHAESLVAHEAGKQVAELESTLRQETAIQETEKDKHIAYLESMLAYYRSIEPHAKDRIAELEEDLRSSDAVVRELRRQLDAKDARIDDSEAQVSGLRERYVDN